MTLCGQTKEEAVLTEIIGEALKTLVSHAHDGESMTSTTSDWVLHLSAGKLSVAGGEPH